MRAAGAGRFDFAVSLCVIMILASVLLHKLNQVQSEIEAVMLDTEVTNLRWGLREAWAHHNVIGQPFSIDQIENTNPMLLLLERPPTYIGEYAKAPRNAKSVWYFDTNKKRLVYLFKDGGRASYRLASTASLGRAPIGSIGGMDLVADLRGG